MLSTSLQVRAPQALKSHQIGRALVRESSQQKEQRIEKRYRLIPLIAEQLKNKNVDCGMIPFGTKTMRQNNKKGRSGTEWACPRRPTANIESKSSTKSLKRLDWSTWKLCVCAARVAPLIIIYWIIVYFPLNVTEFRESIGRNLLAYRTLTPIFTLEFSKDLEVLHKYFNWISDLAKFS